MASMRKEYNTVRSFDALVVERRLAQTSPLSSLKDCVLGIDVDWFVSQSLTPHNKREPLVHAIGGFPSSLESSLDGIVGILKTHGIKPLFVFKGLEVVSLERPFSTPNQRLAQRTHAWDLYERGDGEEAVMSFDSADAFDLSCGSGARTFVGMLIARGLDYMVAPYTSAAQLAYLSENKYVDGVFGPSDTLMYGVDRLVTSIDVKAGTFQWVSRHAVLAELSFTPEQFVDACVAAGCELNKLTFPPVDHMINSQPIAPITALKAIRDLTQAHNSMYAAILAFPDPERAPAYVDRFRKAVAAVNYQPVFKDTGRVEPLKDNDVPNDVHVLVGQRLPDEIMFYLSRGLIGTELLNALSSGVYLEEAPLDGGQSSEYRRLISKLHNLRSKAMNFLTNTLHRYYQVKPAKEIYWFEPDKERQFDKIVPPLAQSIGQTWKVKDSQFGTKVKEPVTVAKLVALLKDDAFVADSLKAQRETVLSSDREILGNTYFRMLQAAEFVTKEHKLSPWGEALEAAVRVDPSLGDESLVAVGLLIQGFLNGNELSTEAKSSDEAHNKHILLISRVATLINLRHNPVGFTGPLSKGLLAFESFVYAQLKAYRWLTEVCLVSLLAVGDADRLARTDDSDWSRLVAAMPFAKLPNAATGIATKSFLDEVASGSSVTDARDGLADMFKQAVNVPQDIQRAFKLWDCVNAGVKKASELGLIDAAQAKEFAAADDWLKGKRF
ncbi:post-transcriptional regulator Mkt1p [Trichomonascus vanleenenianus]|uniref:Mkt1p n=1 Tax=Trichomonascus vanleenenianus TaxID=2268995 RepID=UPI003ECACFC2